MMDTLDKRHILVITAKWRFETSVNYYLPELSFPPQIELNIGKLEKFIEFQFSEYFEFPSVFMFNLTSWREGGGGGGGGG